MTTTHFANGITTAKSYEPLGDSRLPDVTTVHRYFNDFDNFTAADWTVTETQAGATQALTAGDGGLLALVNSAANNDLNSIQSATATFRFDPTKDMRLAVRLKVDDATLAAVVAGLCSVDTTPLDVNDGIYFIKAAGAATCLAAAEKGNTAITSSAGTLVSNVFTELAMSYSATTGIIKVYQDRALVSQLIPAASFPNTVDLTFTLAVSNSSAVARTLTVDYLLVEQNRFA
jgi:hypothetical protein